MSAARYAAAGLYPEVVRAVDTLFSRQIEPIPPSGSKVDAINPQARLSLGPAKQSTKFRIRFPLRKHPARKLGLFIGPGFNRSAEMPIGGLAGLAGRRFVRPVTGWALMQREARAGRTSLFLSIEQIGK